MLEFLKIFRFIVLCLFLQRISIACYAERCTSYSRSVHLSVHLSVHHMLALYQYDSCYDHGVFTAG